MIQGEYISEPGKEEIPTIIIEQDDPGKKLTVTYVSTDVLWIDIEIKGTCDKSSLGKYVTPGDEITNCFDEIIIIYKPNRYEIGRWTFSERDELPESIIPGNFRSVSPEDEGPHFTKKLLGDLFYREWWYYSVVFDEDSDLAGWTATISFNHMARGDLFITKPDMLVVILHSPDGKQYGRIIDKERYLGILKEPSLQAGGSNQGFKVTFDESYVQGKAPNWHVHIEGDNIDVNHDLIIDLNFEAVSSPYWTYSTRPIDKSQGNIASYVFLGCAITGSVIIDGLNYNVFGSGHHEHTWARGILTKSVIRGWDWTHMSFDNGWNIYYCNYYFTQQYKSIKTYNSNPFANIIITTDNGKTLTLLEDVTIEITESDKLFLILNIPDKMKINALPGAWQIFTKSANVELNIDIDEIHTFTREWKKSAHVGMKIGRTTIKGKITWTDDWGDHDIELNGIGTIWHMRH